MKYLFIFFIVFTNCNAFAQGINSNLQYNIVYVEESEDHHFLYEVIDLDDHSKSVILNNAHQFLKMLFNDLSKLPEEKRQILFYIHGMWGGKSFAFNRTYKMMDALYLENASSDIARIVSLKWPGNKMEYKVNKAKLYEIDAEVTEMFDNFFSSFYMQRYFAQLEDVGFDLIAHSLGTELIKEVLCQLDTETYVDPVINHLILASPDLATDVFEKDDCFGRNLCLAKNTTVYFSDRDLTLGVSKNLNKNDRLGRTGPSLKSVIPSNVTFVSVTEIRDENNFSDLMTGHSSFRASPTVVQDILSVLTEQDSIRSIDRSLLDARNQIYEIRKGNS